MEDTLYQRLFEEERTRRLKEYEAEFGPEYRAKHPFMPDGYAIHKAVARKIKEMIDDQ
jgi:hypothetical protein